MLAFAWVFTHRYGTTASLRHLFVGVSVLALSTVAAAYFAPGVVTTDLFFGTAMRLESDLIADAGSVAVIGLVLCLCSMPSLRPPLFWGALFLFGGLLAASRPPR